MASHPDNELSLQRYRAHAARYDDSARFTMPLRARTIALLRLRPGQVVLDVGAGTGLSFELLLAGVGPRGRVLAVEQSPEMFAQACARVQRRGWTNVWQCNEPAERVTVPEPADAVLLNYVHDIGRSAEAVDNVMRQVRPGARVAMAGMKFFPWWTGPLNLVVWLKNRPYSTRGAELWRPWDVVERWCDGFEVCATQGGMGYIASGVRRADRR